MSKESFIKRSAITGKKYDVFDDTIRILNPNQAAFYVSEGVPILDVWLSEDKKTDKPILVYLFKKADTKEVFDLWCRQKEGQNEKN